MEFMQILRTAACIVSGKHDFLIYGELCWHCNVLCVYVCVCVCLRLKG